MILLTGASGFLGKGVHHSLLEQGMETLALARTSTDLETAEVDISEENDVKALPWRQISKVVHLAAAGVKSSGREWEVCTKVNVGGTLNILSCAKRYGVPVIMGKSFYEDFLSEQPCLRGNPYVMTKYLSSQMACVLGGRDLPITLVNIFQCYGPGDDDKNVLNYVAHSLLQGRVAELGPCTSKRDWVYKDDVVRLVLQIILREQKESFFEVDAGAGLSISIREVVCSIAESIGKPELLRFGSDDDRGDQGVCSSASRFLSTWKPEVSLSTGISKLIDFYK